MKYQVNKELRKLNNKQFIEDVKKYIKASNEFHSSRVSELKVLAKRLHEDYELKDFYRVFNRLWRSGFYKERALALFTLQQYKEDFTLETWQFLKQKIKDIKNLEQADSFGIVIGYIFLKVPSLQNEITNFSQSKDIISRRIGISSSLPLVQNDNLNIGLMISEQNLFSNNEHIQKATGILLKEIGNKDSEKLKKFILKHSNMPYTTFYIATENLKELRKINKETKTLDNNGLFNMKLGKDFFSTRIKKFGRNIFGKNKK